MPERVHDIVYSFAQQLKLIYGESLKNGCIGFVYLCIRCLQPPVFLGREHKIGFTEVVQSDKTGCQ